MLKFSGLADLSSCFGKQTGKSPVHTGLPCCHTAVYAPNPSTATSVRQASNNTLFVSWATTCSDTQRHTTSNLQACSCCILLVRMNTQTLKQANLQEWPEGTMHIQVSIDSRNSAIQHVYHTLLHPSSSSQPRHPMLKIVWVISHGNDKR